MTRAGRGRYVQGRWAPDPSAQPRRARLGSVYLAFVPDPIAELQVALPSAVAGELENATLAIAHLNDSGVESPPLEGVARQLLRSESLASSRIEGLVVGHRRIAIADFDE